MKHYKKIISFFVSFATIISVFSNVAFAADYSSEKVASFWDRYLHLGSVVLEDVPYLGNAIKWYYGHLGKNLCPSSSSPDGYHHSASIVSGDDHIHAECQYCGQSFDITADDLSAAYEQHVEEMPVNGVTNTGGFVWYPTVEDLANVNHVLHFADNDYCRIWFSDVPLDVVGNNYIAYLSAESNGIGFDVYPQSGKSSIISGGYYKRLLSDVYLVIPVSGNYTMLAGPLFDVSYLLDDGSELSFDCDYDSVSFGYYQDGSNLRVNRVYSDYNSSGFSVVHGIFHFPVFSVTPDVSALTGHENDYTPDSRPAAYVGDYQIIGDNGELFVDNSTIISEDDNSIYNPVTNTTTTYDGWTYDYSSRTYTFDTNTGDTTTVTYGDENITIKEGDTVYNINYYIAPNGGGDDPTPTPTPEPDHKHSYKSSITREATCTTAGVETFTCECGESYTKPVPSLGHDWTIKEQVPTAYDNGEETTKGYTVYRCTRCGEEYKSTDGTVPDSGGGGSGSVWSKIGELLGPIFGGFFKLIGQFLSAILDVLISLAQEITDKLSTIVEMILGWFDELPKLFTGFLGFLEAVFPFIPSEAMMLLTFGMAAVVFIGIIKALRRR